MIFFYYLSFSISIILFIISFISHFSTYFDYNPEKLFPGIFLLHIGIFILILPVIFFKDRDKKVSNKSEEEKAGWITYLAVIFIIYMVFNFFFTIFYLKEGGEPQIINGKFLLQSHGKIIKELTQREYYAQLRYNIRLFSGHWMFFYMFITSSFISIIKKLNQK